jgi:hypothetical protein
MQNKYRGIQNTKKKPAKTRLATDCFICKLQNFIIKLLVCGCFKILGHRSAFFR